MTALSSRAQEALRMSLAGEAAAEARHRAMSTIGYYNFKIGPTGWRFGSSLGLQYNDNVNLTETSSPDFVFTPQVNAQMVWPVSDKNSLNLSLGVGYSAYVEHPELSRIFITPGSEISFDLYAGDFWINLHDSFSIMQNAYQDPTVAGNGDYSQFQNAAGLFSVWDLDKIKIKAGYDHANYIDVTGHGGAGADSSSELFYSTVGYQIKPQMFTGVELSGGFNHFAQGEVADARHWSVGAFYDTPISEYIHVRANAGYTVYTPEALRVNVSDQNSGEFSGYYAQLAITHHLSRFMDYSLSGGRSVSYAYSGGAVDIYSVNLRMTWQIMRKLSMTTSFEYEHGNQLGFPSEVFDRYGAGITFGRPLTEKLSAGLGYQFYNRTSDQPGRAYTVNIVSLSFSYAF